VALVGAMAAVHAGVFSWLAVHRYQAFWAGRYDLGNMVQAIWSTAHNDPLDVTDGSGVHISRLAAHVDPILVLFAPLWRIWPNPEMLLVAQAVIVAAGAIPTFLLARRWLVDDRLAGAAAAAYLLYPALQWPLVTDFHPFALVAPLMMTAIWAIDTRHDVVLGLTAGAALLCREEVGLAFMVLGVWMAVRYRRRLAGGILAASSLAWVVIAVFAILPAAGGGESNGHLVRYESLGGGAGDILRASVTDPSKPLSLLAGADSLRYVAALLLPLALLSLLAPLLAAAALPSVLLNCLSDFGPQRMVEYHYQAIVAPALIASAILGLARLRRLERPAWAGRALSRPGAVGLVLVAVVVVAGPLPWWKGLPLDGSGRDMRIETRLDQHGRRLQRATQLIPADATLSASNTLGGHLSARDDIATYPALGDAEYIAIDRQRPIALTPQSLAAEHALTDQLLHRPNVAVVFAEAEVVVLRRDQGIADVTAGLEGDPGVLRYRATLVGVGEILAEIYALRPAPTAERAATRLAARLSRSIVLLRTIALPLGTPVDLQRGRVLMAGEAIVPVLGRIAAAARVDDVAALSDLQVELPGPCRPSWAPSPRRGLSRDWPSGGGGPSARVGVAPDAVPTLGRDRCDVAGDGEHEDVSRRGAGRRRDQRWRQRALHGHPLRRHRPGAHAGVRGAGALTRAHDCVAAET
jgi:uncharacterized membrane protein